MKHHSRLITLFSLFSIFGVIVVTLLSLLVFRHMEQTLVAQYKNQFMTDANARLAILTHRFSDRTAQFRSFTELPAFRQIRFHTLSLNDAAVREHIRQLELYFLELQRRDPQFQAVRMVANDGTEVFKVEEANIVRRLGDVSQLAQTKAALALEQGQMRVTSTYQGGNIEYLTLWLPVFTSASHRMGVLAFDVDFGLLSEAVLELAQPGATYSILEDGIGQRLVASADIPVDIERMADGWIVSRPLPLPGLDWQVTLFAHPDAFLHSVRELHRVVIFAVLPLVGVLLLVLGFISVKRVQAERRVHQMAYFDTLTGLVNRNQFELRLQQALENTNQSGLRHALLYLDLDQFKVVNDTCGHVAGDELLRQVAALLKTKIRENDTLARIGGDEFALLLEACRLECARQVANEILKAVAEFRFVWQNKSFGVGISIGLVVINERHDNTEEIHSAADMACYMAKELGRNRVHVYMEDDVKLARRHGEMQWVSRIKEALDQDRFFLECQSIVPVMDDPSQQQRWEILVRMREGDRVISPEAFIPAAERYYLMPEIDRWVVKKAFATFAKLYDVGKLHKEDAVFFINLSGLSLSDEAFFKFIDRQLDKYGIPPESICFEVTETAAIANLADAVKFMKNIKKLGCSLALDDFGAGMSSFSYLKAIPVDYLKIEGSFVQRMLDDPMDSAFVEVINKIGHTASLQTIAEFVADEAALMKLRLIGVDFAQGYGIAKPIPLKDMIIVRREKPSINGARKA